MRRPAGSSASSRPPTPKPRTPSTAKPTAWSPTRSSRSAREADRRLRPPEDHPPGRVRTRACPPRFDLMSTDAIVLLKKDHQEVRRLFDQFSKAGENAHAEKGRLVKKIVEL